MNLIKEANVKGVFIPRAALKLSGFCDNGEAALRTMDGAVVLTRRRMTAMELVETIDSLTQTAAELLSALEERCGPCDGCSGEGCPYKLKGDETLHLDGFLREEAGIPEEAKLCAEVDEEAHTVTFGISPHKHDLTDLTEDQRILLENSGVCLGALEEKLMTGEVVYTH